jgi:hypothetical protein
LATKPTGTPCGFRGLIITKAKEIAQPLDLTIKRLRDG